MMAVRSTRLKIDGSTMTFAAPGTRGRRQSHAKREGRRWGNMNGAHWEDGAAARRTCSTWLFGCVSEALSCGSVSPPPRGQKPAPARRRKRRRRRRRVVFELPCRHLRAEPVAREQAVALETDSEHSDHDCWEVPECGDESDALVRIQLPKSGGAEDGVAHLVLLDMTRILTYALVPLNHR